MYKDFFQLKSVNALREEFYSFSRMEKKDCSLEDCTGRVLAQDIPADCDLPMRSRSSMDGFALRAEDTFGAGEFSPAYADIAGEVKIESPPDFDISPGECARIVTGGILPDSADAVIMFEQTKEMGGGSIEVRKAVPPGENVMLRGEDGKQGERVLQKGSRVGFKESGLMAAFGAHTVQVFCTPRVGIISTGDEVIPVREDPEPGQVRDVNRYSLSALVRDCGGIPAAYGVVRDDFSSLKKAVSRAMEENDTVLVSGGSSVGLRDMTVEVFQGLGNSRILAHGVALSPGKPTILCESGGKALWGLPGQVTSVQVVMLVLVEPFLRYIGGEEAPLYPGRRMGHPVRLGRNIASAPGREDYLRVSLEFSKDEVIAWPIVGKSGLLRTMVNADGLIRIPAEKEGISEGESVWVIRV